MRKITKVVVALAAATALTGGLAACSSSSKKPVANVKSVSGTSTSIALDAGFATAITGLGLTPGMVGTGTISGSTVTFPITGGSVKVYKKGDVTPYVQGELDHNGSGLSFTAGSTVVQLMNFVVHPGNNSNVTGDVTLNGASAAKGAKLFDLDGSTLKPITVASGVATLTGTRVLLSSDAAALLDKAFKTTAVKGGILVGIATLLVNVA
jgi:hypothetical protein